MLLTLKRRWLTEQSTIGELDVDGVYECVVLEDVVRKGSKVPGKTAIPEGRYRVIINDSVRFKRRLPLLIGVPDFEGVRIHPGNSAADTDGCLLPGRTHGPDWVGESRAAFTALFAKLEAAAARGEDIFIEVTI